MPMPVGAASAAGVPGPSAGHAVPPHTGQMDGAERPPAWRLVVDRHAGEFADQLDPDPGRLDLPDEPGSPARAAALPSGLTAAPAVLRPDDPWRHRA